MPKTIEATATVIIPMVPNFLLTPGGGPSFPVSSFSNETLREIGHEWTENLIARAAKQRGDLAASAIEEAP